MKRQKIIDRTKAGIILCQQYIKQLLSVADLRSHYRFYIRSITAFDKFPGVTGGIDIGEGKGMHTLLYGHFYQFLSGKSTVVQTEICFTVYVHNSWAKELR